MVDTNSDPNQVSYPIPANDDSSKSIRKIMEVISEAVKEGLIDREHANAEKAKEKAKEESDKKAAEAKKEESTTEKN